MYRLFGPYWLLRRIGLGEMAEVFVATRAEDSAAHDAASPPLVAIKRVSREMARYDQIMELFAREGELTALLDHPKIARVLEVADVGGQPYIAMEYIPGADLAHLRDRVAPARLPPGLAARVALDLCDALHHVHHVKDADGQPLHVVHGDITPTNIVVSTSGVAKLIDFSVASSRARNIDDTTVRGTYAYMSPEQVRGEVIDRRTDIFALGVVLWELFSGQRLFRRNANYLTLAAVVEDPVPRLADMDIDLGSGAAAMDAVLARALAKDRDDRYAEIHELAAALEPLAHSLGWDMQPWTLKATVRTLLSEQRAA